MSREIESWQFKFKLPLSSLNLGRLASVRSPAEERQTMRATSVLLALTAGHMANGLLPPWPPTWVMNRSTAFMPCDVAGAGPVPFDPVFAASWGISDFDWSDGREWWSAQSPMSCEETLLAQAEATHAVNPDTHVMVYRNSIKALPWFTSVREKLEDPAFWGFFLPYANCTRHECGPSASANLYHDTLQTPRGDCGLGVVCGEYLFDLRNESARAWLRGEYLMSATGMGSRAIHGFYFDDAWTTSGPSEEDPKSVRDSSRARARPRALALTRAGPSRIPTLRKGRRHGLDARGRGRPRGRVGSEPRRDV